jgi:thiol:disulfide interchange protein DsbD
MVDDKRPLPEPIYVVENGRQVKLETYGDRWSYLQRYKFNANSQPYYAVIGNNGELLSGPYFYDEDVEKFINFLNAGKK